MTPGALALTSPSEVPAAAVERLSASADQCAMESSVTSPTGFSGFLACLASVGAKVVTLLPKAISGDATEYERAAIANAARVTKAASVLFAALAEQSSGADKYVAGRWFLLSHRMSADISLTMREYASASAAPVDWPAALSYAGVRVLPGGEPSMVELGFDPLVRGASWDCVANAQSLARFVVVS